MNVGLARVKAVFSSQTGTLDTNFAEIAAYDDLTTMSPSYNDFFSDLTSIDHPLKMDYNNTFVLAFGSSLLWQVSGGTNFWKDQKYISTLNQKESDIL